MQRVIKKPIYIDFKDLSSEDENDILAKRICIIASSKHFDLEKGPLINFHLFKLDEKKYVLLLVMHHIISDGWSLQLLMNELLKTYNSLSNKEEVKLPNLKIQYKDYAAWHNKKLCNINIEKQRKYWKNQYEEGIPNTQLPTDYHRPSVKTSFGERKTFELSPELTGIAKELNSKEEITMFMFIQTVINLFLHNHTKSENIVVGTPVAGRNHPDIENQIGLFLNTLALKNKVTQDKKIKDLLSEVKLNTIGAFDHQIYPFDFLVEDLGVERDISRTPLFNVGFTWQNIDGVVPGDEIVVLDEISITPFSFDYQRVKTDLWFHGWENEENIQFSLTYNKDLFKEETIENYIEEFKLIFDLMSKFPEKKVSEILSGIKHGDDHDNRPKKEKRKKKSFKGFLNVEAKPIDFSEKESMVEIGPIKGSKAYPLVIMPKVDGLLLSEWVKTNKEFLIQHLHKTGALLLRGFNAKNEVDFQEAISALSTENMSYVDQSSPRTQVSNKVYTSTDHPEDQKINMHNELSYSHNWPLIISFFCQTPPANDGETPIADTRKVLELISKKTRDKFVEHGVKYIRNLVGGIGLSWQQVYQTESKDEVEEHCRKNGIDFNWINDDHLRISWNRPAVQEHPKTGEKTWFNHGFFFNAHNLDQAIHDVINDKNLLPFNTFFGNGDEIAFEEFEELRVAFDKCKVKFDWQKGDILILDNMSMAHGRESYQGQRKILVSMNEPFSKINVLDQV
ncbi:MAG: alpha-ketoglutarate-dependent taurine dioxygenase [Cyclobacteriaceae bacterium]|jgi:alpha-ketoglutarate-dependent taurine dioxygenase